MLNQLALLFSLFVVAHSICPNSCNTPHGSCVDDRCVCTGNYAGDDCSIYDQYLNSGEVAYDRVVTNEWKFYRHNVLTSGATLVWYMNQTEKETPDPFDEDPDGDLYVQYGNYPTLSSYLLRNVTLAQNNVLTLKNAQKGIYYAGVFGYSNVHYAVSITETLTCPDNCNDHGDCVLGQCECYANYGGNNCMFQFRRLNTESPLVGQVFQYSWEYFFTEVDSSGSELTFVVTELVPASTSDCDVYLAFERTPSLWDWDYSNVTIGDVSTITLSNAEAGRYTLGIYGYFECSFRVTVSIVSNENSCNNDCSDHGSCVAGECECQPGFQGDSCEWREAPLTLSQPQGGYVGKNSWNYYHARVITESILVITVTQTDDGDCDLYVRADDKPTRFEFDYVDMSLANEYSVYISEPGDHTWYIGVYGWDACHYSMVLDEQLSCACGVNNPHGDCHEGYTECFCHAGWTGANCSNQQVILENGVKASSSVQMLQWKYFELPVTNTTTGIVSLKETSSTGLLWLFVSFTGTPSLASYDFSDKGNNRAIHEIPIATSEPTRRNIFIGVYGNPFNAHNETALDFDLVAWGAPF